jgi:dihydrofolate synthase/folylpolyglutamate synthase
VSYAATLDRLRSLSRFGVRLGLERMARVLDCLGRPQRRFSSVHLAGTNGKGSTAAMLASCLAAAGYRTGLYTSPHLCRFSERIRVSGTEIRAEELEKWVHRVLALEPGLTFFEAATAVALAHFAEQQVEVAVVETGLGGRLDATNVLVPRVSVLTRIDLDHQEILGSDLTSVAREKAGIIKQGVPAISAPAEPEVQAVIRQRCTELDAPLRLAGQDFVLRPEGGGLGSGGALSFETAGWTCDSLQVPLAGDHQLENATLCLGALSELRRSGMVVPEDSIRQGLRKTRWPGRMEWVGPYLLDGAHNASGARALAAALEHLGLRVALIMGLLGPKDPRPVLEPLLPHASRALFTRPRSSRAIDPRELSGAVEGGEVVEDLPSAIRRLETHPGPRLVTGSLYLVGEARALLLGEPVDPVPTADPMAGSMDPTRSGPEHDASTGTG